MTLPSRPLSPFVLALLASSLLSLPCVPSLSAQPSARDAILKGGNVVTGETPVPSPFDAFLALDKVAKQSKSNPPDWNAVLDKTYIALDTEQIEGTVPVCLALGVRISDGLIAVKAQNAEKLNSISRDIETLARKLDVSPAQLGRAEKVRKMATDGDWLGVFLELGFLQVEILEALGQDSRADQRPLILASGWVQGFNSAALAISQSYSPAASNLLREPKLIEMLDADLRKTSPDVQAHPSVKMMLNDLPALKKLCDIPQDGVISLEGVKSIQSQCNSIVEKITG